jgi:hypothetical protein
MVWFFARRILHFRQRDGWDALADIEVFIFTTEVELEAMEADRVGFIGAASNQILNCGGGRSPGTGAAAAGARRRHDSGND